MAKSLAGHSVTTNPPKYFVEETHQRILQNGAGIWTDVYQRLRAENHSGVIIAALVPESRVEHILQADDWGFDPQYLRPGCVKFGDGRIVYCRYGSDEGY